jgi:hypothetical protein
VAGTQYRVMPRSFAALLVRIDARPWPALQVEDKPS